MELLLLLILILSLVSAGVLTVRSNPKSLTNRYFFAFICSVAIWIIVNFASNTLNEYSFVLLANRLIFFSTSFVSWFLYQFALCYSHTTVYASKKYLHVNLIITVVVSLLGLSPFVVESVQIYESYSEVNFGFGIVFYVAHFLYLFFLAVKELTVKYFCFTGLEKLKVQYLVFGITISLIGALVTNLLFPLFGNFSLSNVGPFFFLFFVVLTTYSIVQHRFLDINLIVARSFTYSVSIFSLAVIYTVSLFRIENLISGRSFTWSHFLPSSILALVVGFTFQPLLRVIENITDKVFFKGTYNENDFLKRLAKILASTVVLKHLGSKVIEEIVSQMRVSNMHIILFDKDFYFSRKKRNDLIESKSMKHLLKEALKNEENILIFDEMDEAPKKEVMRQYGLIIFLPLVVDKKTIGVVGLEQKSSGEIYSEKDIRVLKIVAPEMAIAFKNALSFEEISQFNITLKEEVKKATHKLRQANLRLKELDKEKDEFLSIASHELRTPMTAIRGYLWMILNKFGDELNPKTKKYITIGYKSAGRLIELVNDMLTVSRMEQKRLKFEPKELNFSGLVKDICLEFDVLAQENKIVFEKHFPKDTVKLLGDDDRLREVFTNILGNAFKFTPAEGKIIISMTVNSNEVIISISDSGPGIRKEDLDKLFTKFGKLDHSYEKLNSVSGTGLGLYISKRIVVLHKGSIEVESKVNKGTTFTVRLPLQI